MPEPPIKRFKTSGGRSVYRMTLEVIPDFFGNAYLITGGRRPLLVDCGSGQGSSRRDLERGLANVRQQYGETVAAADLGAIVITHGHIDHFGGLRSLGEQTDAPVWIHALDRRVLTHYEERQVLAAKAIEHFLEGAGIGAARRAVFRQMYLQLKRLFRSLDRVRSFQEGPLLDGELEAIHVPGHCPGQVCLRLDDLLLTADHLLPEITPHISPESITPGTGWLHYLDSLDKVSGISGIRLGLGGHGRSMPDIAGRGSEIRRHLDTRLAQVLDFCREPRTVKEISREVFGQVSSYHVLLALLETGSYVEHLSLQGELSIANPRDADRHRHPVFLYRRS